MLVPCVIGFEKSSSLACSSFTDLNFIIGSTWALCRACGGSHIKLCCRVLISQFMIIYIRLIFGCSTSYCTPLWSAERFEIEEAHELSSEVWVLSFSIGKANLYIGEESWAKGRTSAKPDCSPQTRSLSYSTLKNTILSQSKTLSCFPSPNACSMQSAIQQSRAHNHSTLPVKFKPGCRVCKKDSMKWLP
jgi:hypothetical protein